jgi:flavodoxin
MATLVVYYSKTGNTKAVAASIARATGGELEELIERGVNRAGVLGWLRSGRDGMRRRASTIESPKRDVKDYDTVFVGSPVWGWNLVPAVRSYLSSVDLAGKRLGFFCTMGSSGDRKTFDSMRQLAAGARVPDGLAVREAELGDRSALNQRVQAWVKEIQALGRAEESPGM